MPCNQWSRLVEQYRSSVLDYSDAARALSAIPGSAFNDVWQRVDSARSESERRRAAVLQHEHQHACLEPESSKGHRQMAAVATESLVLGDQGQSGG
jgi:hypothetical protein